MVENDGPMPYGKLAIEAINAAHDRDRFRQDANSLGEHCNQLNATINQLREELAQKSAKSSRDLSRLHEAVRLLSVGLQAIPVDDNQCSPVRKELAQFINSFKEEYYG